MSEPETPDPGSGPAARPPRDGIIAPALGLALAFVYLRTLCPTVYLGDSGEIATAITVGGVVHPPGYPLFTLLSRIFLHLAPVGEPAYRIGIMVALAGGACIGIFYLVLRELGASRWAAATAAAVYGASFTFWNQATRVEVYTLHLLFIALVWLGALRYRRTGLTSDLILMVLPAALDVAHHLTIVVLAPAVLVLCGRRLWSDPGRARRWSLIAALVLIGPALYGLLVLSAVREPMQAWGRPVNLTFLYNHVSAKIYQGALALPKLQELLPRLNVIGHLFVDNFPWLGFGAALTKVRAVYNTIIWTAAVLTAALLAPGARALFRRDRTIAAGLLVAFICALGWNLCYGIADIAPYFLPAWLVLTVVFSRVLDNFRPRLLARGGVPALALTAAVVAGYPLVRNWSASDLSRATWVREFARNKLESAAPNSILISGQDPDTFPIWYVQQVLGVRRDVLHLDFGLLISAWSNYHKEPSLWYVRQLRRQGIDLPLTVPPDKKERFRLAREGTLLKQILALQPERPVAMTFLSTGAGKEQPTLTWISRHYNVVPQGLLLSMRRKDRPVHLAELLRRNEEIWGRIELPDVRAIRTDQEIDGDYVIGHYACMLTNYGGLYERAGRLEQARAVYAAAKELAPGYKDAANALAGVERTIAAAGKG